MTNTTRLTALLLITALWLLSSCETSKKETMEKNVDIPEFLTQTVKLKTLTKHTPITGRVIPSKQVLIVAENQGIIISAPKTFEDGIRFKKGELMLIMDDTEFKYSLSAQKSQYINSLIRSMSDIQLDYPEKFTEWQRFLTKLDTRETFPDLPEVNDEQLRLFLAGRGIYEGYYAIKGQEERLKKYRIYAPFNGVITVANVDVGDLISPGMRLGEFISTDDYEVITAVGPSDIDNLQIGRSIELKTSGIDGQIKAKVKRIGQRVDSETQSINVYLDIKHPELKAGMYMEGNLSLSSYDNAFRISKRALSRDEKVFLIQDSTIVSKKVQVIDEKDSILVQGLTEGSLIILQTPEPNQIGIKAIAKK